jgi:hypothetical protein
MIAYLFCLFIYLFYLFIYLFFCSYFIAASFFRYSEFLAIVSIAMFATIQTRWRMFRFSYVDVTTWNSRFFLIIKQFYYLFPSYLFIYLFIIFSFIFYFYFLFFVYCFIFIFIFSDMFFLVRFFLLFTRLGGRGSTSEVFDVFLLRESNDCLQFDQLRLSLPR